MRVLGIIPARGGSQGLPKKNIKNLNGYPLIAYTIKSARESKLISEFIVSTDDIEISKIAMVFGASVPFLRPAEISKSESSSLELIVHALEFYEKKSVFFDAVCLLQPTSPFRPSGAIDDAIVQFTNCNSNCLVSVREVPSHYNPYWTFKIEESGSLKKVIKQELITRRQNLPKVFHRDGAIYLFTVDFLKHTDTLISEDTKAFIIDSPELINIDTENDWKVAERYIKY